MLTWLCSNLTSTSSLMIKSALRRQRKVDYNVLIAAPVLYVIFIVILLGMSEEIRKLLVAMNSGSIIWIIQFRYCENM